MADNKTAEARYSMRDVTTGDTRVEYTQGLHEPCGHGRGQQLQELSNYIVQNDARAERLQAMLESEREGWREDVAREKADKWASVGVNEAVKQLRQ